MLGASRRLQQRRHRERIRASRQPALPLGQVRLAGAGTAALLLGADPQLLLLPQPGGKPPQVVHRTRVGGRRHRAQGFAEIPQCGEAAPAAAETAPHRIEGRHPAVGRPLRHGADIGLQQVGVRKLQCEPVRQLFEADQNILHPDRHADAADCLLDPLGEDTDLIRLEILGLEAEIGGIKPGQRGEGGALQGFRGCGRRQRAALSVPDRLGGHRCCGWHGGLGGGHGVLPGGTGGWKPKALTRRAARGGTATPVRGRSSDAMRRRDPADGSRCGDAPFGTRPRTSASPGPHRHRDVAGTPRRGRQHPAASPMEADRQPRSSRDRSPPLPAEGRRRIQDSPIPRRSRPVVRFCQPADRRRRRDRRLRCRLRRRLRSPRADKRSRASHGGTARRPARSPVPATLSARH